MDEHRVGKRFRVEKGWGRGGDGVKRPGVVKGCRVDRG